MEISFANSQMEQLCSSLVRMRADLGDRGAATAAAQLASLRAAACLDEFRFLPGRCRERDGWLTLRLRDGRRLIFEPTAEPPPTNGDGSLDWSAIQSVRIVAITRKTTTDKKGTA